MSKADQKRIEEYRIERLEHEPPQRPTPMWIYCWSCGHRARVSITAGDVVKMRCSYCGAPDPIIRRRPRQRPPKADLREPGAVAA